LGIAVAGSVVCVSSAIVPDGGVVLGVRMVVAVIAGLVFIGELVTLVKPDAGRRVDDRLARSRWGAVISRVKSRQTHAD
jgi:hypothetical protein